MRSFKAFLTESRALDPSNRKTVENYADQFFKDGNLMGMYPEDKKSAGVDAIMSNPTISARKFEDQVGVFPGAAKHFLQFVRERLKNDSGISSKAPKKETSKERQVGRIDRYLKDKGVAGRGR